MLLAVDTSTDSISLALMREGVLIAELSWLCGKNHSVELLPHLISMLEQAGSDVKSLSGVVVAVGPGSFNGLRVGVTTAKGLAFSLNIPLAGVSTLEAAAYQQSDCGLPVCAVSAAGRGEIAAAVFRQRNGVWQKLVEEHITTLDALCADVKEKTVFAGEYVPAIEQQLREKLGENAVIPPPAEQLRRAGFLAELGRQRLDAGRHENPATLQPLYLKRPAITTPKRKLTVLGEN